MVSTGINRKIPFRGSLGYGKIFLERRYNLIMGPAVDEVAEWHDKSQIIGIFTAPSALLHHFSNHKGPSNENTFVKHKIRMKNLFDYKSWITNWPEFMKYMDEKLQVDKSAKHDFRSTLERKLFGFMKIDDFQKIQNSIKFYEEVIGNKQ